MQDDEQLQILEEIARDPNTTPTAKCTAIRTIRSIVQDKPGSRLSDVEDELQQLIADKDDEGN